MKMTKKKVFVVALAVCLLAILSVGSLAWFSAQDSVENQFHVADSEHGTTTEMFDVEVYEFTENSPTDKVYGNDTYEYVVPGAELKKEAHVANVGHYDQYIRVVITVSDAANWSAILAKDTESDSILDYFVGYNENMWTNVTTETIGDSIRIVMYYDGILDGDDTANDATSGTVSDIIVFDSFAIPGVMDLADADAFGTDGFTITVKAQAVQTENVGADAYAAFQTVGMAID